MKNDGFMEGVYFIAGLVMGAALLLSVQEYKSNKAVKNSEILKLTYSKDELGNCYAAEPHSQRFTWIPCELTKDSHENNN